MNRWLTIPSMLIVIGVGIAIRVWMIVWGDAYTYYSILDEIETYKFALDMIKGKAEAYRITWSAFNGGKLPGLIHHGYLALSLLVFTGILLVFRDPASTKSQKNEIPIAT